MKLVLDSSVTLTWCFIDERSEASDLLLDRVADSGALAPSLWPLEILNALIVAERRQRISAHQRDEAVSYLRDLPITLDKETTARVWTATRELAERHQLTLYDATYLELALRLQLPLATLDQPLRAAAAKEGVGLLGLAGDVGL